MLKEFDLDAPTLSKGSRYTFRSQTRCVTALYERLFSPFRTTPKAWKMLIEVVPRVTKPYVRDLLGVLTLQIDGDPTEFLNADPEIKPRIALDLLTKGARAVAKELDWPIQPFEDTAQAVLEEKFVNRWLWKKGLWNKSKSITCDIEVEHRLERVTISAHFRDVDQQQLASVILYSTSPSEFAFVPCLGKVRWIDDRIVELVAKNGKECWQGIIPEK